MEAWDAAASQLSRDLQDATYMIGERDQARRQGDAATDLAGKIRGAFVKIDRQIEKLDKDLKTLEAAKGAKGNPKDVLKRRDTLRNLTNERSRLKSSERTANGLQDRGDLLRSGAAKGPATEGTLTRDLPPEQLMLRTQTEIKVQDDILDNMSKGLDNLKNMGLAIRDETDLHMKLLDDVENEVDKGNASLKRETARAEHITRDTRTCWLYSLICVLLVVLMGLVMARWA